MRKLSAADLFCGGGGTSQGAEDSGAAHVVFAVNHWPVAIQTHSKNFPHAKHACSRIDQCSPAECPKIDVLFASPECCHHSRARGGRPMSDQQRAMAWDVLKWAEYHRPSWIVVENVTEWEQWGPLGANNRPLVTKRGATFDAWIMAIRSLGYTVDWRRLNAANYGAATSRTRLFVVARKGRRSAPWPEPTHSRYTGGELSGMALKPWRAAWEIIDWSKPCPSIFSRKRPLADKTLLRIEAGLRRFCSAANAEAFVVKLRAMETAESMGRPLTTVTTSGANHAVAVPFVLPLEGYYRGNAPRGMDQPLPTITGQRGGGHVVTPFLVPNHGEAPGQGPRTHSVNEPAPTIAASNATKLCVPYMVATNHGGEPNGRHYSVDDPLGTISTHNGKAVVQAFLTSYYGTGGANSVADPVGTVTTKHRHGLAMVKLIETMQELNIVDIGFRMLDVDELARATGFREGYYFAGSKADVTRQIGNAVPPVFSEAITREIAA